MIFNIKCNYSWPRQDLPENPSVQYFFAEYIYKHTSPTNQMLENRVIRNNKVTVLKTRAALTSFITEK